MKNFTKYALALLGFLSVNSVMADDEDKLVVVTNTDEKSYAIDEVRRIDLSDTGIKVLRSDETGDEYAFDDIRKIVFTTSPTGIETPMTTDEARLTLFVSKDGNTINVRGWQQGVRADVDIYSASGAKTMSLRQWNGGAIDISTLAHGIYVIKVDKQTAKFRK